MASRRSNKSHKVPNVRLRPALPSSSSRPQKSASHDSGFESEYEASYVDTCPRPFRDVVLCATRIQDKTTVFKQAIELGAQSLNDLTDRVTHVLATEPGSAKYRCAVEFRLPIMHPSWITESYEIWLRGDDVNFEESVKKHNLPTFTGVVLCISGIEDEGTRVKINKLVTQGGGTYVKDITRPVKVTHLICGSGISDGSEKVKYAERFNANREADIQIIWEEWFWDSVNATGRRDEQSYSIKKPRPARQPTPDPGAPQTETIKTVVRQSQPQDTSQPSKATADDSLYNQDDEGPVLEARLPAVTVQAWEGMLKSRGFQRRGSNFFTANVIQSEPQKARPLRRSVTEVPDGDADKQAKILASFRRTDSFAPASKDASTPRQRQPLPFRRASTLADITSFVAPQSDTIIAQGGNVLAEASLSRLSLPPVDSVVQAVPNAVACNESTVDKKPFIGLTLRAVGEIWQTPIRSAVEKLGGRLVPEDSDEVVNYIIVRLVSGSKLYRDEIDEQERPKYRTECWLERCLNEERLCPADEHVLFVPLKIETPIPGAELIKLNYTGLNDEEICWVKRLSRVLGFTIPDAFSRQSTHLLCSSRSGVKFDKAQQWGVSVVDMSWLTDIAVTGGIASISVQEKVMMPAEAQADVDSPHDSTAHHDRSMVDITNDHTPPALQMPPPEPLVTKPTGNDTDQVPIVPNGLLGLSGPASDTHDQPSPSVSVTESSRRTSRESSTSSLNRQMSLADLRKDMKTTCIPSSETPSPVKPPSKPTSPVKLDMKAAVGLLNSINSLVKRPSTDEDGPKRRPKRARPASHTTSTGEEIQALPGEQIAGPSLARVLTPPQSAGNIFDPFLRDESGQLVGRPGTQDESVRITYEDPAQQQERSRLMKLMEAGDEQPEKDLWEVDAAGVAIETQSSSTERRKSQRKTAGRRRAR